MMPRLTRASVHNALTGARFLGSLVDFLRHPVGADEARATVAGRLHQREADFLDLARRAIYATPDNATRELLQLAGCEYGDLARLVHGAGLEGALRTLYARGVYLTVDEFKGRHPVRRGSATLNVDPSRLANPLAASPLTLHTSGSRGPRTVVPINLAAVRENVMFASAVPTRPRTRMAIWSVPGGAALFSLLIYAANRTPVERWFTQVDPSGSDLAARYRWSERALRLAGTLAGVPIPASEYVPVDHPLPVAHWLAEQLRQGQNPVLDTFATSAARLCQAATDASISLAGARFVLFGEPLTPALLATIRDVGAEAYLSYAAMEAGVMAFSCGQRAHADDMHLFTDLHAVVQPGTLGRPAGLPPTALLLTSLRPTAAFTLLNVSLGDAGELAERACGCSLERAGWTTHLHTVRSFEKLTAGGMTFLDTDVIPILEQALPSRFGGGPTAYQLVEEAATDGTTRLVLLVHPSVGPLDPTTVVQTFLELLGEGTGAEHIMAQQWRQSNLLRVDRRPPLQTATGKIHHLHRPTQPA